MGSKEEFKSALNPVFQRKTLTSFEGSAAILKV
jgi:hypothetical protein